MAKRIKVSRGGVVEVTEVERDLTDTGAAPQGQPTAVERMKKMRSESGGDPNVRGCQIKVIEYENEKWHLKIFDWTTTTLAGILVGREGVRCNADGELISVGEHLGRPLSVIEAFTAVLLHVGVVCGTEKPLTETPYFSIDVAREYATEPLIETKNLVGELFHHLTELNPEVLPLLEGTLRGSKPSEQPTA